MGRSPLVLLSCLTLSVSGCAIVELGVRNPVPGLETVAVVPFFNLSQERTVDGREFALAYYSELQKVPGFEVLPVGVAERAIFDNGLSMSGPEDALALAKILNVDAVVIGAVTDFDAYNPRIGLKISWYSPQQWLVLPNRPGKSKGLLSGRLPPLMRAQSPDSGVLSDDHWEPAEKAAPSADQWNASTDESNEPATQACFEPPATFQAPAETRPLIPDTDAPEPPPLPIDVPSKPKPEGEPRTTLLPLLDIGDDDDSLPIPMPASPFHRPPQPDPPVARQKPPMADPFANPAPKMLMPRRDEQQDAPRTIPALVYDEQIVTPSSNTEFDPHEPLMAYVRIFDSTDRRLVARLADYLELSGESRSGNLEAWMQRTEFFRKFTAHVMISEMLALHGGESRRRLVLKPREYR